MAIALLATHVLAETNIEEADRLFAEGVALRDTNLAQSCEKFNQSLAKNPQAIGTLMNVALCDRKLGRIASAVERFSEARDRAKEGNLEEYEDEAQKNINELTPDLPKVTIRFAEKLGGTRVLVNERVIPDDKIGGEIPVDPGELVIVVSAPGRVAYETKVIIAKRELKPIDVPVLKKAVTVTKSSRKTIGIITAASGGALVVTGVVLGLVARSKYNDNFPPCDGETKTCPPEVQPDVERARTIGQAGTVVGAVGIAAIGVGAYLWLSAPREREAERNVTVVPTLTPESAGLTAVGRF